MNETFTTDLILIALIYTLYRPSLSGPFLFDDLKVLASYPSKFLDPLNRHQHPVPYFFKQCWFELRQWRFGSRIFISRIFTWLTYMFDAHYSQLKARDWHRTNLLIHMISTLTVHHLLLSFLNPVGAALGALVFAAHPLSTMAVGYISGRSSLLAGCMTLLALFSFVNGWWVLVVLFCVLALLSKEEGILAPLLIGSMVWLGVGK